MWRWTKAHRGATAAIVAIGLIVAGFGVYWFAPHRLFLDREIAEAVPTSATGGNGITDAGTPNDPSDPVELASGSFRSLEHVTSGLARIVKVSDGSRFVRLEDLETSDGPDLRIYLTDQPVSDDWRVWDDGEYVDLGALKGNVGDSNYEIPADVDLSAFETVVIWCRRFTVGFGVAPI